MLDALQTVQEAAAINTALFTEGYEDTAVKEFSRPLKIGYTIDSPVGSPVSHEAKQAVLQVVQWLEEEGHHVEEVENGVDGKALMQNYFLMNSGEMATLV